jgi:POLQ-like helicase
MSEPLRSSRARAADWPYPRYSKFRSTVAAAASAWFREHELETEPRYPYILADRDLWPRNILVQEVVDLIKDKAAAKKGIEAFPLHKYIHHGLSSQALLFNLMGPSVARGEAGPLAAVLSAKGVELPVRGWAPEFEYGNRAVFNEDSGQPTSIDLALRSPEAGVNVFVECKFVEREFGQCSVFTGGDCDGRNPALDLGLCYLHHVGRRYWDVALEHGLLDGPLSSEALCPFAVHYQFFRELLLALEEGGVFVLLSDARSPVFFQDGPQGPRGLMPVMMTLLPEHVRRQVVLVTVQEVLEQIVDAPDDAWVSEFRRKYGLELR